MAYMHTYVCTYIRIFYNGSLTHSRDNEVNKTSRNGDLITTISPISQFFAKCFTWRASVTKRCYYWWVERASGNCATADFTVWRFIKMNSTFRNWEKTFFSFFRCAKWIGDPELLFISWTIYIFDSISNAKVHISSIKKKKIKSRKNIGIKNPDLLLCSSTRRTPERRSRESIRVYDRYAAPMSARIRVQTRNNSLLVWSGNLASFWPFPIIMGRGSYRK